MKHPDNTLPVPLYVKSTEKMPWPAEEGVFHLLTQDGLFICRNNKFFVSSVPVKKFPSGLAEHHSFLRLRYPKVPRRLFELMIGFFSRIAELHHSEAGVLLAWDEGRKRMELIVPEQTATVGHSYFGGRPYPVGLYYDIPRLPPELTVIGSAHSHVDEAAYSSSTDKDDERHRPGLHIVVGRIGREPPEVEVEAVVDGTRFFVEPNLVLEGYERRRTNVPAEWIKKVKVEEYKPKRSRDDDSDGNKTGSYASYDSWGRGGSYNSSFGSSNSYGGGGNGYGTDSSSSNSPSSGPAFFSPDPLPPTHNKPSPSDNGKHSSDGASADDRDTRRDT